MRGRAPAARRWRSPLAGGLLAVLTLLGLAALAHAAQARTPAPLDRLSHVVVVFQENHSFDNLYGGWEGVDGLAGADPARTTQVRQDGTPWSCLLQLDVNLTTPPVTATCSDVAPGGAFSGGFANEPFRIDAYIPPAATTCPPPGAEQPNGTPSGSGLAGGCTRDIVHAFYQEQYQLNGGRLNRFATGSDAAGLTMGVYDTRALPIYRYLHRRGHPRYVIADRFFQAAFGGSFLNHQWLVAAATPTWPGAVNDGSANDMHSVVDGNGMPVNYPLYHSPAGSAVHNGQLTASCDPPPGRLPTPAGIVCGDHAVNTVQPTYQPYQPRTAQDRRLPPQRHATIGERLSAAGVSWAWYSGGWSNASGRVGGPGWTNGDGPTCADPGTAPGATYPNCPNAIFQYHHQPLNYFAAYAPGTPARRRHLRDKAEFQRLVRRSTKRCRLRSVSFVKAIGEENEHPGYASEPRGSDRLVELLRSLERSACRTDTMIVVTYDEFGGQWDHVPPPGSGGQRGPRDRFGPGTRVPALVLAPFLPRRCAVDGAVHDTTSILATIERRFGVAPLTRRDAVARDLSTVFRPGNRSCTARR